MVVGRAVQDVVDVASTGSFDSGGNAVTARDSAMVIDVDLHADGAVRHLFHLTARCGYGSHAASHAGP